MLTRRSTALSVGAVVIAAGTVTALAFGADSQGAMARLLPDGELHSISLVRDEYPVWMELPPLSFPEATRAGRKEEMPSDDALALETATMEQTDDSSESPVKVASVRSPVGAMASLRFNIADFGMASSLDERGTIRTSKPVMLAGNRLGTIELAVGQGSSVSIDRKSMAELLGDKSPALASTLMRLEGDRVTLEDLRSREVAVRYDPLADALVIEPRL